MPKIRQVLFYKHYFEVFYLAQNKKIQDKIIWTIKVIESHNQIAEKYFITIDTVRSHIKNIYKKLSINSKAQLFKLYSN